MSVTAHSAAPSSFRSVLGVTVAFLCVLLLIAALASYREWNTMRQQERQLRQQIEQTRARVEVLQSTVDRLEHLDSPREHITLERLARQELGLVRPGDVVVLLPPEER